MVEKTDRPILYSTCFRVSNLFLPDFELPVNEFWIVPDDIKLVKQHKNIKAFVLESDRVIGCEEAKKKILRFARIAALVSQEVPAFELT